VIVSSQYIHDLSNSCIKNLDYTLIFKSFNREKLLVLFESLDLSIDFELFEQLYQDATAQPFNFSGGEGQVAVQKIEAPRASLTYIYYYYLFIFKI